MKRLLQVLVVVLLAEAAGSLALGLMLFRKREELKGRTQKLERTVLSLAATIEETPSIMDRRPDYPARDIDSTTSEVIDAPQKSAFWDRYRPELELSAPRTMALAKQTDQLGRYYRLDPITQERVRDPLTGAWRTDGEGTMQELLDDLTGRAGRQLSLFNATREHLRLTREELVSTVTELNTKKQDLRLARSTIVGRDRSIATLEDAVKTRDQKLQERERELADVRQTAHEQKRALAFKDERIMSLSNDVQRLSDMIAATRGNDRTGSSPAFTRGYKGQVTGIERDWNFVVLRLTEDFLKQYRAARERSSLPPDPELYVVRDDPPHNSYVTKVKLNWVDPAQGIGVADVLTSWQQAEVQKGDRILH